MRAGHRRFVMGAGVTSRVCPPRIITNRGSYVPTSASAGDGHGGADDAMAEAVRDVRGERRGDD